MKTIARPLVGLMLLIGLSVPAQAQNPAVRMTAGPPGSVTYSLKNLGAAIAVGTVELVVFDAKTCKKLCATKSAVNKKIAICQILEGQIRCPQPPPPAAGYIYFLRVRNTGGVLLTENWLFVP
jgi:hypothetical protein